MDINEALLKAQQTVLRAIAAASNERAEVAADIILSALETAAELLAAHIADPADDILGHDYQDQLATDEADEEMVYFGLTAD